MKVRDIPAEEGKSEVVSVEIVPESFVVREDGRYIFGREVHGPIAETSLAFKVVSYIKLISLRSPTDEELKEEFAEFEKAFAGKVGKG